MNVELEHVTEIIPAGIVDENATGPFTIIILIRPGHAIDTSIIAAFKVAIKSAVFNETYELNIQGATKSHFGLDCIPVFALVT